RLNGRHYRLAVSCRNRKSPCGARNKKGVAGAIRSGGIQGERLRPLAAPLHLGLSWKGMGNAEGIVINETRECDRRAGLGYTNRHFLRAPAAVRLLGFRHGQVSGHALGYAPPSPIVVRFPGFLPAY